MVRTIHIIFLICISSASTVAQEYLFKATSSETNIEEGSTFTLEYEMQNIDQNSIKPPRFKYFDVVSGPNSSYSMQSINGVTIEKQSVSYVLLPKAAGRFVIPAATATVKRKRIKSNLVKINVVKPDSQGSKNDPVSANGDVFVRAEMSHDTAFLGQQIFINYNIYFSVQVENWNMMNESEYNGFFAKPLRMGRGTSTPVEIEGKKYYKQTVKRIALFPQQTGKLKIESSRFRLGVSSGNPKERRSIWSRPQIKYKFANCEDVFVNVLELPEGAPASFSGAVGSFEMSSVVKPTRLTTDDAFIINMNIYGTGDVKYIRAPDLEFDPNLEVYDKKVLTDNVSQKNNRFLSSLGMEYQVLPKKEGRYTIVPEFTFFNPDSLQYITINNQSFKVFVTKGSQTKKVDPLVVESEALSSNIKANIAEVKLQKAGFEFRASSLFWLLSILPLLGFIGALAYKRVLLSRGEVDLVALRQSQASQVAVQKLEKANAFMKAGDSRSFFDEISKALLGYANDKLQISNAEMSKDKVAMELKTRGVNDTLVERLTQVFKKSEMALFAGQADAASLNATYEEASAVIVEIEKELN